LPLGVSRDYISTVDQLTVRRVAKDNAVSDGGVVESRRRGGAG